MEGVRVVAPGPGLGDEVRRAAGPVAIVAHADSDVARRLLGHAADHPDADVVVAFDPHPGLGSRTS